MMRLVLTALLLAVSALALDQYIEDTDRFPGWRGELPTSVQEVHDSVGYGELGQELWRGRVEQISWRPRAFLFHNFLSDEECDHLIGLGEGHMTKSTVVDSKTGSSVDSKVRTSSGTFLQMHQDPVVERIEKRLAHVTMIPEENGESIQLLKYVNGQKYEPHTDYFHDKVNADPNHGGQRVATVLMYLTTPDEGGETVFPYAEDTGKSSEPWSDCAMKGLAVKAKRGNALLFYSLKPDGSDDSSSTHGSCPTLQGVKWSATKWIHVGTFNKRLHSNGCEDRNERCEEWAGSGECTKNPSYMENNCPLACNRCKPKQKGQGGVAQRLGSKLGRKGVSST